MSKKHEKDLQSLAQEFGLELVPSRTRHFYYAFHKDGKFVARTGRQTSDPRAMKNLRAELARHTREQQAAAETAVQDVKGETEVETEAEVEDKKARSRNAGGEAIFLNMLAARVTSREEMCKELGVSKGTVATALSRNWAGNVLEAAARLMLDKLDMQDQLSKMGTVERDTIQLLEENEGLEKRIADLQEQLLQAGAASPKRPRVFVISVPDEEVEWLRSTLPRIGATLVAEH